MPKHPLLPKDYADSATQAAIVFALGPYKISDRADINNPQMKWNLTKAWQVAEGLLEKGGWKPLAGENEAQAGYEMAADSEKEQENLNLILAGLVAYQIMEPESGVFIRRVEFKKGGEMSIVISTRTANALLQMFPRLLSTDAAEESRPRWWNWKNWIKRGKSA